MTWKTTFGFGSEAEAAEAAQAVAGGPAGSDAVIGLPVEAQDGLWRIEIYADDQFEHESLLPGHLYLVSAEIEFLAPQDWVALSQKALAPVAAGRFLIHGSHDRARARGRAYAIEIDAGQAFGTAHHATTAGCLVALDRLAKRGFRARRILDAGTGSGVLAIAAARLFGNAAGLATDIDPVAIRVARENVARNGAKARVSCHVAAGLRHPLISRRRPFDLICANILAAPLIALAHEMSAALRPGGVAILSGLLDGQAPEVGRRYDARGFSCLARESRLGWTTLTLMRRRMRPLERARGFTE